MASGFSGTPLAKKLSLKDGMRFWWDGMPESVQSEICTQDLDLRLLDTPEQPVESAHTFVVRRVDLEDKLAQLLPLLASSGFV